MTYTDIITRLEAATGADRELDAVIMCAIGGARRISETAFHGPDEKSWSFGEHEDESNAWCGPLPYVTASRDASFALVAYALLDRDRIVGITEATAGKVASFSAVITIRVGQAWKSFGASAPSSALAVLLALFKALQGEEAK